MRPFLSHNTIAISRAPVDPVCVHETEVPTNSLKAFTEACLVFLFYY